MMADSVEVPLSEKLDDSPKVSIGLPVYNGEEYLSNTLDCLLGQTFLDIEVIISDDGSLDRTRDICLEYCERDKRVRYFRQDNNFGMPVKNFRFVLDKSRGEYFMFASHDDSWDTEYIEKLVKVLDGDQKCSLAFSNYKIKNLKGNGEILIDVSSSVSESKYVRYMTRLIDVQPALIFGLFRRELIESGEMILADMFTLHFGNLMSLRGKVKVVDEYMMSWGIDGSRKSYSITGNIISYRSYYLNQVKLIFRHFNFLKWHLPIILLSVWLVNGWIRRRLSPHKFNINFDE